MNLSPTDSQRMLHESVERFVSDHHGVEYRRTLTADPGGSNQEDWRRIADLGWLGLPFAEEAGGFGGGPVEIGILMEEFGRGAVTEPYLATVLLASSLVKICGDAAQKQKSLPEIVQGDLLMSFSHTETDARYEALQQLSLPLERTAGASLPKRHLMG